MGKTGTGAARWHPGTANPASPGRAPRQRPGQPPARTETGEKPGQSQQSNCEASALRPRSLPGEQAPEANATRSRVLLRAPLRASAPPESVCRETAAPANGNGQVSAVPA